jgi:hypothetical protein
LLTKHRIGEKMARKKTEGEPRTNLLLSLSVEDKKFLKIYAAERGMTVAAVIHEFVEGLRERKEAQEGLGKKK